MDGQGATGGPGKRQMESFNRAAAACLSGRAYTVNQIHTDAP